MGKPTGSWKDILGPFTPTYEVYRVLSPSLDCKVRITCSNDKIEGTSHALRRYRGLDFLDFFLAAYENLWVVRYLYPLDENRRKIHRRAVYPSYQLPMEFSR